MLPDTDAAHNEVGGRMKVELEQEGSIYIGSKQAIIEVGFKDKEVECNIPIEKKNISDAAIVSYSQLWQTLQLLVGFSSTIVLCIILSFSSST